MQKEYVKKWTTTAIREALYDKKLGGWVARKNTHKGCCDFLLLDKDLMPKVFKTAEEALKARSDKKYHWYH